ncbi:MAG: hypothetical protein IPF52_14245 [Saprospiraceae bacterium]|nr:hypothetical protein [Saprospiraceae bacterium]
MILYMYPGIMAIRTIPDTLVYRKINISVIPKDRRRGSRHPQMIRKAPFSLYIIWIQTSVKYGHFIWVCILPEVETHQKNKKNEGVIYFIYRYKQVMGQKLKLEVAEFVKN